MCIFAHAIIHAKTFYENHQKNTQMNMKKLFLSMAVAAASLLPAKAQLLYRISGKGLQKVSYIVGTYHLADGSYTDQIPGLRKALTEADQVCGELDFVSSVVNADSIAYLGSVMRLPEGKTLRDVLTEEQFQKVDAHVEKVLGMKLTNPMLYGQMGSMSPASLSQTLNMMELVVKMQKQGKPFDPQNGIDSYLQKVAYEAGKKTLGLETVSYQAKVLFGDSMENQVKGLMCSIENAEFNERQSERLVKLYYEQNIEKLYELTMEKMGNECDSKPEDWDKLLFGRNANWIKLMPSIMKQGGTLFVVGAAHLGGERGVLKGLQKAGYKVEGVK